MPAIVCLFPLEPVLDLLALDTDSPVQRLADRMRQHSRTILKWKQAGGVDLWTADRIATAMGMNAEQLWPGWEKTADWVAEHTPTQYDLFADAVPA